MPPDEQLDVDLAQDALGELARCLLELDERRRVEPGEPDFVRETQERLHGGNLGVDRCSTCRRTGLLDSHGLERGLDVIDGRVAQICPGGCERRDEA